MNRRSFIYGFVFAGAILLTAGVTALLLNIFERQQEGREYPLIIQQIPEDEIDPAAWGVNFPKHYDRFMMTQNNYGETPYGGSEPYSKLDKYPAMVRLWAGYAFAVDHNEERGHFYSQIDQANTQRVKIVNQPGACINCHAGEAPQLIASMGWAEFNRTPYNDLADDLHYGSVCADCHEPNTMELRITRPGLINAMEARGFDVTQATRQEMRTLVCAQCHVEYYFAGDDKLLTFPWTEGLNIDNIQEYYIKTGFTDWTHAETGGRMIKIQHPEYELFTTSLHYSSGVACADCHMPYIRDGGIKISDHWVRSPLVNVNSACQTCHNVPEEQLVERILTIQNRTAALLRTTEDAIIEAIDMIVAARNLGATDEDLAEAFELHRWSQMRWDFISSENSTGFHSPQESARVLADAIDGAHRARISALEVVYRLGGTVEESVSAEVVSNP